MPPLVLHGWIAPAVVVALAIMGLMYGPKGALLPELFQTRYRYSGAALAYNLGGAVTPVVATLCGRPTWAGTWPAPRCSASCACSRSTTAPPTAPFHDQGVPQIAL